MWLQVQAMAERNPNLRVLASIDPSNTDEEIRDLETLGVSTMFYGDNEALNTETGGKRFKCPKTWGGPNTKKGACGWCKKGCFRNDKPVHVHLKQH